MRPRTPWFGLRAQIMLAVSLVFLLSSWLLGFATVQIMRHNALQEQKHMRLVVSVPEAYTSFLNARNSVKFTVKSLPDHKFTAQVKRLAGALDNRPRLSPGLTPPTGPTG